MPGHYAMFDVVFSTALLSSAAVSFIAWQHFGIVIVTMIATALWALMDLLQLYRLSRGQEPAYHVSSIPQAPELPMQWYATALTLEAVAIFSQVITGYTLVSCMLLVFVFGGAMVMLHLLYFSGGAKDNVSMLLPTLSMAILAWLMMLTAPAMKERPTILGEAFWLLLMTPIGGCAAYLFLTFMGLQPKAKESEPIVDKA